MTPPCMHCGQQMEQHEVRGDERWCRDGLHRFNFQFVANPEVIDFVRANADKSPKELATMWIERVRGKRRSS